MDYKKGDKVVILDGEMNDLDVEDTGKIVTITKIKKSEPDRVFFHPKEVGSMSSGEFYLLKEYIRKVSKLEKALL
jgi:hypothetical protein